MHEQQPVANIVVPNPSRPSQRGAWCRRAASPAHRARGLRAWCGRIVGVLLVACALPAAAAKPPNILFVIMDDVGIDQMQLFGYGGDTPPATPTIDRSPTPASASTTPGRCRRARHRGPRSSPAASRCAPTCRRARSRRPRQLEVSPYEMTVPQAAERSGLRQRPVRQVPHRPAGPQSRPVRDAGTSSAGTTSPAGSTRPATRPRSTPPPAGAAPPGTSERAASCRARRTAAPTSAPATCPTARARR